MDAQSAMPSEAAQALFKAFNGAPHQTSAPHQQLTTSMVPIPGAPPPVAAAAAMVVTAPPATPAPTPALVPAPAAPHAPAPAAVPQKTMAPAAPPAAPQQQPVPHGGAPSAATIAAAAAQMAARTNKSPFPRPTPAVRKRHRRRGAGYSSAAADGYNTGKWTKDEDASLKQGVAVVGAKNWKRISQEFMFGRRSDVQCLHRWQKVLKPGLTKGAWEKSEDAEIVACIAQGINKWSEIAARIPGRLGKQCRERWFNHLDPTLKKTPWTPDEDLLLVELQGKLGNRWCKIAEMLPGRSENAVKNRWHSAKRRAAHAAKLAREGKAPAAATGAVGMAAAAKVEADGAAAAAAAAAAAGRGGHSTTPAATAAATAAAPKARRGGKRQRPLQLCVTGTKVPGISPRRRPRPVPASAGMAAAAAAAAAANQPLTIYINPTSLQPGATTTSSSTSSATTTQHTTVVARTPLRSHHMHLEAGQHSGSQSYGSTGARRTPSPGLCHVLDVIDSALGIVERRNAAEARAQAQLQQQGDMYHTSAGVGAASHNPSSSASSSASSSSVASGLADDASRIRPRALWLPLGSSPLEALALNAPSPKWPAGDGTATTATTTTATNSAAARGGSPGLASVGEQVGKPGATRGQGASTPARNGYGTPAGSPQPQTRPYHSPVVGAGVGSTNTSTSPAVSASSTASSAPLSPLSDSSAAELLTAMWHRAHGSYATTTTAAMAYHSADVRAPSARRAVYGAVTSTAGRAFGGSGKRGRTDSELSARAPGGAQPTPSSFKRVRRHT